MRRRLVCAAPLPTSRGGLCASLLLALWLGSGCEGARPLGASRSTPRVACIEGDDCVGGFVQLSTDETEDATGDASCSIYGCGGFRKERACQCNSHCVSRNDCCSDFVAVCVIPNAKSASVVGKEVTYKILVEFWACAGIVTLGSLALSAALLRYLYNALVHLEFHDKDDVLITPEIGDVPLESLLAITWYTMKFKVPALEEKYELWGTPKKVAAAAQTLAFVAIILCAGFTFRLHQILTTPCLTIPTPIIVFNTICLVISVLASMTGLRKPTEAKYWPALLFNFLYLPATCLPPLAPSCWALKTECSSAEGEWVNQAYRHVDCSLSGQTSMQMLMTWLILQPWLFPRLEYIYVIWIWIFGIFVGWTLAYDYWTSEAVYDVWEITYRVFLLSMTLVVAIMKKFWLEKNMRLKFAKDMRAKDQSRKMFCVLEYMMPFHVVGPMLADPGASIAEQIGRVSIMFILITEFDKFTSKMTPTELLRFLNDQFTQYDEICTQNKVTKIETVGEEYVAAVGVLPSDIEDNDRFGHAFLLDRLFTAGGKILDCQTDTVRLKMGIHSGPIVAGVIGTKLPRYRLFGDTINSAARMMQKGLPGQCQFGVETYGDLSEKMKEQVKVRGEVEMKGKGKIMAYTYCTEIAEQLVKKAEEEKKAQQGGSSPMTKTALLRKAMPKVLMMARAKKNIMEAGRQGADAPDSEQERRFEEALKTAHANDGDGVLTSKYWLLSERAGFTDAMEEEWGLAFHETAVLKNIEQRFGCTCILFLFITALELQCLIRWHVWRYPHSLYDSSLRWPVFIYTRGLILFLNCVWWLACDTLRWVRENPAQMQFCLVITNLLAMVLMFISYDSLAFSDNTVYREMMIATHKGFRAPEDQSVILNFVLAYYLLIGLHKMRFFPLTMFLPLSFCLVGWARVYRALVDESMKWEDSFSYQGEFLLFLQTMMNLSVAHDEEQASRASFKAEYAVRATNERTEKILDTLMPPLVVEQIRSRPPNTPLPSHQYRHATIAQSDLCGFTQLSATKKPTEVVKYMGDLFGLFDDLTDVHGVYKVETVGDAYIAGMAERPLTRDNSPYHVILFGLDMVRKVDDWARDLGVQVACRCGIHYGECMGGIVGNDMQRYHLFGDLLTVLEVMESTSEEGRVQVSKACKEEVMRQLRDYTGEKAENLHFVERDAPCLKTSKGEMHDYDEVGGKTFLVESNKPLRHIRQPEPEGRGEEG